MPEPARALVALLGGAALAIPAELVAAVVRPGPVTPVGGAEPWLVGMTAVRGRVLPVADLGRLTGVPPAETPDEPGGGWYVVVDDGRRAVALAGLRVRRLVACDSAADTLPRVGSPPGLPVRGIARLEADTGRGADALPPRAALVDVAALLDLVYDP